MDRRQWLLGSMAAAALASSRAQAADSAAPPPGRIGQLSWLDSGGQVRLAPGQAWEPAQLNLPLATGAALQAAKGARLEARIGSTALRLAPGAGCEFTALDDARLGIELLQGRLVLRLRALAPGESCSVTAGGARVQLLQPGLYRLSYAPRLGVLALLVLQGQARLQTGAQETTLGAGEHRVADARRGLLLPAAAPEDPAPLEEQQLVRDRRAALSPALRHVHPEMTGAEALDGQGSWHHEPGYGAAWFPDGLPPDWAPYRYGRWRWHAPWGWTWVDDAPWGFAPFHYGRWLFQGGRWGWLPGSPASAALNLRPVYAPALVGFYGSPGNPAWSPAAGAAALVGWYPLAPGELYWPASSDQAAYLRALNAPAIRDAALLRTLDDATVAGAGNGPDHRYARTAFAATAMPAAAFVGQQAVAANQVALLPAALAAAPLSARRLPPPLRF